ncbi:hypothetical protein DL770_005823 [Monosporascus sp. CRB-9-2]|nr:hypothetical protein DL770_005823 [Monosporascus sp. CRB-9-2]
MAGTTTQAPSGMTLDLKYDNYDYPVVVPNPKSGHPGNLSEEQIAQVHQLRMQLESEGYTKRLDTLTLLRFLRARKFDVNLAKQMFVNAEKWRAELTFADGKTPIMPYGQKINLDEELADWDKDRSLRTKVAPYYPQYYHKTDKDGRPVYIEQLGKVDRKKLEAMGVKGDHMLTNLAVEYERMADPRLPACSRKAGYLLETSCTIMDLKGVGLFQANAVKDLVRETSKMSQDYYPERMGRMYMINAGRFISALFSWAKSFLDPVTQEKIHVISGDGKAELLAQIPAENLPKEFGGTCECPGGCALSNAGPWQDPQWVRPAWYEKESGDAAAIQNQGTNSIGTGEGAAAGGQTTAEAGEEAKAPAPAAA